jgi:hypothetical protein
MSHSFIKKLMVSICIVSVFIVYSLAVSAKLMDVALNLRLHIAAYTTISNSHQTWYERERGGGTE